MLCIMNCGSVNLLSECQINTIMVTKVCTTKEPKQLQLFKLRETETALSAALCLYTENIRNSYLEQAKPERRARTTRQLEKRIGSIANKDTK